MSLMEEQKNKNNSLHSDNSPSDTIPSFLLKTYQILENDKFSDIISWTRNGEGFIVKKIKEFAQSVLPIYFRHSNYTSFVRQLNMYDFHKTRQENHENAFKNLMFKRGYKHLLKDIQRKDYKKNKQNNKETSTTDKVNPEKIKDQAKIEKQDQVNKDITNKNIAQMNQINNDLQKRALSLAEIRQIPIRADSILKLIDLLFDTNKMQKQMLAKLQLMENILLQKHSKDDQLQEKTEMVTERWDTKHECYSTDVKMTHFQTGKEDKLTTYNTLFSSFKQG